jgi:hypothetical protein
MERAKEHTVRARLELHDAFGSFRDHVLLKVRK